MSKEFFNWEKWNLAEENMKLVSEVEDEKYFVGLDKDGINTCILIWKFKESSLGVSGRKVKFVNSKLEWAD